MLDGAGRDVSLRVIVLHIPKSWPWETAWTALFDRVSDRPRALAA